MALTEQEKQLLEIIKDPIKWGEATLRLRQGPFRAREYQKAVIREVMSDSPVNNRVVLRWGRRLGKCLAYDTEILDPATGELITAEELYERKIGSLVTMNDDYGLDATSDILIMDNGIKDIYRVITQSGRKVDLTLNHPLLTIEGWKEVGDLKLGERIAVPMELPHFGNTALPEAHVKLLAYIIGDGGVTGGGVRFSTGNNAIRKEMQAVAEAIGVDLCAINIIDSHLTSHKKGRGKNNAINILREHEVFGKNSFAKRIPKAIMMAPKEQVSLFLNRLFACDGWASLSSHNKRGEQGQIGYCSVSEKLIYDVQHLLLRFGIMSNISKKHVKYNSERRLAYQLLVSRQDSVKKFAQEINIFSKEDKVIQVLEWAESKSMSGNEDTLPEGIWQFIEEKRTAKGMTKTEVATGRKAPNRNTDRKLRMQYAPSKQKVVRYAENMQDDDLLSLANSPIYWDPIVSISFKETGQTYDVAVAGTHNLVANDVLVHNTTIMAVYMIWYCFTHKNAKIIIAAPYDAQVGVIFKMLREFIDESPEIRDSLKHNTKNPQYIEFYNGSALSGFTAGTRSGSKGDNMRGQAADWIFLDEMDRFCFSPDALVMLIDGKIKEMKDVHVGDRVFSYDSKGTLVPSTISHISKREESILMRTYFTGGFIDTTPDHPMMVVKNGELTKVNVEDINNGDWLCHPLRYPCIGRTTTQNYPMDLIGYYLGDGSIHYNRKTYKKYGKTYSSKTRKIQAISLHDKDEQLLDYYIRVLSRLSENKPRIYSAPGNSKYIRLNDAELLERLFSEYPELERKEIPLNVMQANRRDIAMFLRGYFDAEGWVNTAHGSISSVSFDHKLTRQIQMLLLRLGIQSTLAEHKPSGFSTGPSLWVTIADSDSVMRFADLVGFNSKSKTQKLNKLSSAKSKYNTRDVTRYPAELIKPIAEEILSTMKMKFPGKQALHDACKRGNNPTRRSLELVFDSLYKDKHYHLAYKLYDIYRNVYYVQVKNTTPIENPYGYTVDATVPENHVLFVDNVLAHNSDDDIDSIAAIALEDPDRIGIWASSTPTGKRGKFYKWCNDPENWTHLHYPSTANPTWSERAEREFRAMLSEQGYVHEVMAEFGEETIGVFKKQYIDRAKEHDEYDYLDRAHYPAIRVVGVDWDKYGEASQIIVTEFDPNFIDALGNKSPKFRVINRSEIAMSEFTLDNAVKKIIELNDAFNPAFIYCDRGYGEYQIETLHKYGMMHPHTGLHEKVKGFHFNQAVPVRDPHTKLTENKPFKPFMVNQATVVLERDQLILNKKDQLIWKQMENYQVVKMSIHGQPTYTSEDEHALDALMLSLLGFSMEFPNITKILQEMHVARHFAMAPKLKNLSNIAMSSSAARSDEQAGLWDPNDPEERRGHLIRKSVKEKQTAERQRTTKTHSWGARGTSTPRSPKSRQW